jgi:sulfite reductase (ferredoxin)
MAESFYQLPAALERDISAHEHDVNRFLSGSLSASIFKARRVPRGIYEQRQDGVYMVRIRVAGGALSGGQMLALAKISKRYGNGVLHVTTRQDLQLHDINIADTPGIMRDLLRVGLSTKGGGGNTVRNVTACPYAGICPAEVFDVTPFAHAVTEYLIDSEGSWNLPRKYKIAFSGCSADCALAGMNDLGFIAKAREGRPGFSVYAGGGMGAHSRPADPLIEWVETAEVIRIAETLRRLFDRLGDRHNRHRARLRFVVEKLGPAAFRDAFRAERAEVSTAVPFCSVETELNSGRSNRSPEAEYVPESSGIFAFFQKQDGFVAVPLSLPLGDIPWHDLEKLAGIAERFSKELGLRTTQSQGFVLRFVSAKDLPALTDALRGLSIDVLSKTPLQLFVSCTGAATCRLGLCLSRRAAAAGAEAISEAHLGEVALRRADIKISGCPNACGQHPIAAIGLFGAVRRVDGRLVPGYKVLLGGRQGEGKIRLGQDIGLVPARALPGFLQELLGDFQEHRASDKTFLDYCDRRGLQHFTSMLAGHADVPSYEENMSFYRDWGQEEDFSLAGRGAGECGAGVFEVIADDIAAAKKLLARLQTGEEQRREDLFPALLSVARALLFTRGIDTTDPDQILRSFETLFVDTRLVDSRFRDLLSRARGHLHGWRDALEGRVAEIVDLLARVDLLYSTLDSDLQFHPPAEPAAKVGKNLRPPRMTSRLPSRN